MDPTYKKIKDKIANGEYESITNARRAVGSFSGGTTVQKSTLNILINKKFGISRAKGSAGLPVKKVLVEKAGEVIDLDGVQLEVKEKTVPKWAKPRLQLAISPSTSSQERPLNNLFARVAAVLAPGAATADWLELLGEAASLDLSAAELASIVTVGQKISENMKAPKKS